MKILKFLYFPFFLFLFINSAIGQVIPQGSFSYTNPEEFTIEEITATGIESIDQNALISITGLRKGDKIVIPGEALSNAIKKIWEQKLVGDVQVSVTKIEGNSIYLNFELKERPRLSAIEFKGVKKSDKETLQEKINISLGQVVTDPMLKNSIQRINKYYIEKGFLSAKTEITKQNDTIQDNKVKLNVQVKKGPKVKINEILITGNENQRDNKKAEKLLSDKRIKRKLKETKEKKLRNILSNSKYIKADFDKDKQAIIDYYNSLGYRDAQIVKDSIYYVKDNRINILIDIEEGPRYYFRNITWQGNYIYSDRALDTILNIKKGDIYNLSRLERRLNYNPDGYDISSLYMDDGYLFFHVEPVEVMVENDSIDIEMRVYEGPQATIKNITVSGNTKTHDHVILRELRTLPGQKFSRSDLIRSQRELATLGYFDPEQIGINPIPNAADGTVDISYSVVEKPSDQIELSGGWGGQFGFVGTLGLVFNNFSLRNIPKTKTWDPLPSGDGQRFSIRFQANGKSFQTYSASFTEPWLGGNKPHSLTTSLTRSQQNRFANTSSLKVTGFLRVQGLSVSYGKRLKWPDDYFSTSLSASYMQYQFKNYGTNNQLGIDNTSSNNITLAYSLSRNSLNDFTFPTNGSSISFTVTATPPYSVFNKKNYSGLPDDEKYKFVEYHKWMLDQSWFTTLIPGQKRNLVLNTRFHFGFLGAYTNRREVGPFERFIMGGDGLSGFNFLLGSEIVGLRGYDNNVIKPYTKDGEVEAGGVIFDKFVTEVRYPISLSPALSIFALTFFEAGNVWNNFQDFNPFDVYRSAGIGTRIMMPAFGMIGIDWGYRLNNIPGKDPSLNKSHVTFVIGQQIR